MSEQRASETWRYGSDGTECSQVMSMSRAQAASGFVEHRRSFMETLRHGDGSADDAYCIWPPPHPRGSMLSLERGVGWVWF